MKTKLSKAIGLALTGMLGLSASSVASAHVMYNTTGAYTSNLGTNGASGTDGNNASAAGNWVGTAAGTTPFGYNGGWANWAAHMHSTGASLVVSSQDAHDDYGIWADIDTAKGAWNDGKFTQAADSTGWGHNTDVGLFKSDVTQMVKIIATNIDSGSWQTFGISVFTGMNSGSYNHHGEWNVGYTANNTDPATSSNPLGMSGLNFSGYTDDSSITFTAQAGQVYSILLGGYSGSDNWGPHSGYQLTISSVPVPGAVWLFGSAMAGLIGFSKRKRAV